MTIRHIKLSCLKSRYVEQTTCILLWKKGVFAIWSAQKYFADAMNRPSFIHSTEYELFALVAAVRTLTSPTQLVSIANPFLYHDGAAYIWILDFRSIGFVKLMFKELFLLPNVVNVLLVLICIYIREENYVHATHPFFPISSVVVKTCTTNRQRTSRVHVGLWLNSLRYSHSINSATSNISLLPFPTTWNMLAMAILKNSPFEL